MNQTGNSQGISVIIPVYNEESSINFILDNLYATKTEYPIETIIVDGSIKKNTLAAIDNNRIIKISSPKGRGIQMNAGASRAGKDILLFLHADTILPAHAFKDIMDVFNTTSSVAGAFNLSLDNPDMLFRLIGLWASLKHKLTRVPYGDQAIFIKKDYFEQIGGYADIPLMEDVELMKRIKRKKDTITILKSSVKTSARKWEKEGTIRRIIKNWMLQAMYLFGASPAWLAQYYYGGKNDE